ncbi:MAG: hypothetical protein ACOVNY_12775, partial [Chitinophagaceae bacterium]
MKYSQSIGIFATVLLVICCFLPWTYIETNKITISGFNATGTSFGRPGMLHIYLSVVLLTFFAVPKIWAKRTNLFIATLNIAWSIRNYILISACLFGECPQKKIALYGLVIFSTIILVMTLLPKIVIPT